MRVPTGFVTTLLTPAITSQESLLLWNTSVVDNPLNRSDPSDRRGQPLAGPDQLAGSSVLGLADPQPLRAMVLAGTPQSCSLKLPSESAGVGRCTAARLFGLLSLASGGDGPSELRGLRPVGPHAGSIASDGHDRRAMGSRQSNIAAAGAPAARPARGRMPQAPVPTPGSGRSG